ncbi:MAG: hypothetical protein M3Y50_06820 [Acidobacteriota bacterium]|nr:hypothetical protein [Acidobacteriota bacterium]
MARSSRQGNRVEQRIVAWCGAKRERQFFFGVLRKEWSCERERRCLSPVFELCAEGYRFFISSGRRLEGRFDWLMNIAAMQEPDQSDRSSRAGEGNRHCANVSPIDLLMQYLFATLEAAPISPGWFGAPSLVCAIVNRTIGKHLATRRDLFSR